MNHLRCLILWSATLATMPFAAAQTSTPQASPAAKNPTVVYILRHAEKPPSGDKSPDLTPIGFKRAALIPTLFAGSAPRLLRPDAIFATDASKHSNRPYETIEPLGKVLHVKVNHDFADPEVQAMAKEVVSGKYAGKVVVICWHHGEIPHLAQAFGVSDAPRKWNEDVFDQIWRITWPDGQIHFDTMPEHLLPGDSTR